MKVTFADFGESLASSRLRASIPQRELGKLGIQKGFDVLVYGKHWLRDSEISQFGKKIYDVCDDHFSDQYRDYYIKHIQSADAVTCNSEVMKQRIYAETGVSAHIISEPYESEEKTPTIGDLLFWYGHRSNLGDIYRVADDLRDYSLVVMTNDDRHMAWSPENFRRMMRTHCIVIIPTGKSMAKSENRMVEAIRNGKYVCAEYLPSYEPFYQFFPCCDIAKHVADALDHPENSLDRIREAQAYISDRYSPETIAKQWLEVINEHI